MPRRTTQTLITIAPGLKPEDARRIMKYSPERDHGVVAARAALKTDHVVSVWSDIFARATGAISDTKLNALGADRLAVIAGIATDKWLALRGMPSMIVGHLHEHVHDLDKLRVALVEECDRRRVIAKSDTDVDGESSVCTDS